MDIVIINTSKLRVALSNRAKSKGYKSVTAYLAANGINSSVINKTEGRFSRYADRVSFSIDVYTTYGAVYEDVWKQLSECAGANKDVFEIERLKGDKGTGHYGKLEPRIAELEDRIKNLEKMVDDLRKELGVD
jgi:hypothetical protein